MTVKHVSSGNALYANPHNSTVAVDRAIMTNEKARGELSEALAKMPVSELFDNSSDRFKEVFEKYASQQVNIWDADYTEYLKARPLRVNVLDASFKLYKDLGSAASIEDIAKLMFNAGFIKKDQIAVEFVLGHEYAPIDIEKLRDKKENG